MKNSATYTFAPRGENEIEVTRVFDATPQQLFDAWMKPEWVQRWLLGLDDHTMPVCEIDARVGGRYRFVWSDAAGNEMGMGGTFLEIDEPHRIVSTELFDEDWTGGETRVTTSFLPLAECSKFVQTIRYASPEARDAALHSNMSEGIVTCSDRLEGLLATVAT